MKEKRISDDLFNEPIEKRIAVLARQILCLMCEVRVVVDCVSTADTLQIVTTHRLRLAEAFGELLQKLRLPKWIEPVGLYDAQSGAFSSLVNRIAVASGTSRSATFSRRTDCAPSSVVRRTAASAEPLIAMSC